MSVKVLFFGKLADIAQLNLGKSDIEYTYTESISTLSKLKSKLIESYPDFQSALNNNANLYAVNHTLVRRDVNLEDNDEVAFMSPFSGG